MTAPMVFPIWSPSDFWEAAKLVAKYHGERFRDLPLMPDAPIPAPPGHPESDDPNAPHKGEV
jgi:hypothetical protein